MELDKTGRIFAWSCGLITGFCAIAMAAEMYQHSRGEPGMIQVVVHRVCTDIAYLNKEWTLESPGIPGLPNTHVADNR